MKARAAGARPEPPEVKEQLRLSRAAHRFGFDDNIVRACIGIEVALVDAEKEDADALGDEFAPRPDENKVVVVVADDGDQPARRGRAHQLIVVGDGRNARGRGDAARAERDAARGGDTYALAAPDDETAVRPAVGGVVAAH